MPYSGPSDPKLPKHVRRLSPKQRRRWVAIWNDTYARTKDEGKAFAAANAAISERRNSNAAHEYASASTIRRRVFARYALGPDAIDGIAREVAVYRTVAYEERLAELAKSAGISGTPKLTDAAVLRRIARESRDVAAGIVQTHNAHLRGFVRGADRGLSQRALAGQVRAMLDGRAAWKEREIARTESMAGRNQAAVDVLRMNEARVRVRAEPRSAGEAKCAAIVAHGWYDVGDAPALPAHTNCVHSYALDTRINAVFKNRDRVWLGDWVDSD